MCLALIKLTLLLIGWFQYHFYTVIFNRVNRGRSFSFHDCIWRCLKLRRVENTSFCLWTWYIINAKHSWFLLWTRPVFYFIKTFITVITFITTIDRFFFLWNQGGTPFTAPPITVTNNVNICQIKISENILRHLLYLWAPEAIFQFWTNWQLLWIYSYHFCIVPQFLSRFPIKDRF